MPEVCHKLGISDATFYIWRKKYGGISPSELKHMRQPEDENLRLKKLSHCSPSPRELNLQQRSRLRDDRKITARHGIIPTRKTVDLTQLSDSERKVYGLVRNHFLTQFLPDHEVDKNDLRLNCAAEMLVAGGSVVIVSGWRQLFLREMATHSPEETQALPALQQGQTD